MEPTNKLYCSLDIETSGFDPGHDEILEIGFAFFEIGKKGIKITEEYSKVFKPKKEVPETILALTGITQAELGQAEDFSQHRQAIQEKLKDAVVVGHNINFDVGFLKSLGIEFKGEYVDTLDLAQFILPTHPSYNLENLMHFFGVPHTEAHRALADAKATLKVLESLLNVYSSFDNSLKEEISRLMAPSAFVWKAFLDMLTSKKITKEKNKLVKKSKAIAQFLELESGKFYNFPLGFNFLSATALTLSESKEPAILVVPNNKQVMDLWKNFNIEPAFVSQKLFAEKTFAEFVGKPNLSSDELKFALKVLVWKKNNWQHETIEDLNLSFFGGQFKNFISYAQAKEKKRAKLVVCDTASFLEFTEQGWYKNRRLVLCGLENLEKALSGNLADKVGWGQVNYFLKSLYNPETGLGNAAYSQLVEEGLKASDLFFGLSSALVQSEHTGTFVQIKFDIENLSEEKLNKIEAAAENFMGKIAELNRKLKSEELEKTIAKLNKFFKELDNRVRWLELYDNSFSFNSSSVKIESLARTLFVYGKSTVLCDCLPKQKVWKYYQDRFGAQNFEAKDFRPKKQSRMDLFSFVKGLKKKLKINIQPEGLSEKVVLEYSGKENLPGAVLFGNSAEVKEFYFKNHEKLKKYAFVLAQTSGGSRVLRNFSIHKDTLLLATGRFVLKSLLAQGAGAQLGTLPVKTLVLGSLPFDQFTHPYLDAVSKLFNNPFEEFSLPKALLNLHRLIEFCHTEKLENLVVADTKLKKPYAAVFKTYLSSIVDKASN